MSPGLSDVATSAGAALGVAGLDDVIGIGQSRHVVVLLVDGLGFTALDAHRELAPALSEMTGASIRAAFPTTTPVGLGSFGTGLSPGSHGLVGAAFRYPESDEILMPLHWGGTPTPVAVQPEPTVFERLARADVRVTTVAPAAYRESGLTRAVLRGGAYVGAEAIDDRVAAVRAAVRADGPTFTYVYWPELDRIGHESGVDSEQWRAALGRVDGLVAALVQESVPGTSLVVTADHGMVDCPPESRLQLEDDPGLRRGVARIAGEPRARHVYVEEGADADVAQAWTERLAGRAQVLTRQELVDGGYFGAVDPALEERIGDLMAIALGDTLLASHVDTTVSGLRGQHGALTADEVLIPALLHRTE